MKASFFYLSFKKIIKTCQKSFCGWVYSDPVPSPALVFCLLSLLSSSYVILGHLSWRSYWLKCTDCLKSCISSCSLVFLVIQYVKSIHFCTAVQFYRVAWSLRPFFFFLCTPILLNGHLVKSCLYRLTAIEVLEKKPDPCTYTLTNRIKMSRHKWNVSLCFPVRFC